MDYSILMTTRYHEERSYGRTPKEAAQQSLEHCSQSILTSGLTFFAATVGVAAISKMELLKSICLLISRGALISMAVILIVLPAALMLLDWIIRHTPNPPRNLKRSNHHEEIASFRQCGAGADSRRQHDDACLCRRQVRFCQV